MRFLSPLCPRPHQGQVSILPKGSLLLLLGANCHPLFGASSTLTDSLPFSFSPGVFSLFLCPPQLEVLSVTESKPPKLWAGSWGSCPFSLFPCLWQNSVERASQLPPPKAMGLYHTTSLHIGSQPHLGRSLTPPLSWSQPSLCEEGLGVGTSGRPLVLFGLLGRGAEGSVFLPPLSACPSAHNSDPHSTRCPSRFRLNSRSYLNTLQGRLNLERTSEFGPWSLSLYGWGN